MHLFRRTLLALTCFSLPLIATTAEHVEPTSGCSVLLLGASTPPGGTFLRHGLDAFREHYKNAETILVIVDASNPEDRDRQSKRITAILNEAVGCETLARHQLDETEALNAVAKCDGVFVGGGQTFLLLRSLYERGLVKPLRKRIQSGLPYAGSSAGANIAGPNIGMTNDFPVADIPTRSSLAVFPTLINPHHPLADHPNHDGRAGKILWTLSYNTQETVLGLSEPGIVRSHLGKVTLIAGPAWIYRHEKKSGPFATGDELTIEFNR